MSPCSLRSFGVVIIVAFSLLSPSGGATIHVDWDAPSVRKLQTEVTCQVVVNPLIERSSPVHDQVYQSLADLGANTVRFVPWLPYPKLGVAELEPPTATSTNWNFTYIDPIMEDFMAAQGNRTSVINFSTPPTWLFNTSDWSYPADPDTETWDYEKGTDLRDRSGQTFGEYYGRLVSYYTRGGFTDEIGAKHTSPYNFDIAFWEVLNEVEGEHKFTPESYTVAYDAVVSNVRKMADPDHKIKFMGMALEAHNEWNWYNYFLNHSNHQDGIPLDLISFHHYATCDNRTSPAAYTQFFPLADAFFAEVTNVIKIRDSLSPETKLDIDEIGVILPHDNDPASPMFPPVYWNAAGAHFAYVFANLSTQGVELLGESQLVGYPALPSIGLVPQFPSVALLDWNTGKGNARYWVLKLLLEELQGADVVISETVVADTAVIHAQGYNCPHDQHKVLVINKSDGVVDVRVKGLFGHALIVDEATGLGPARKQELHHKQGCLELNMQPFAVAIVMLGL